jgi:hypothetical protein
MEEGFGQGLAYTAADAEPLERAAFIRRTYLHLAAAIVGFVALETLFFATGVADAVVSVIQAGGKFSWLFVLAAFMGVSWIANKWAHSDATSGIQYLGLIVYIIAEALIFIPLLYVAAYFGGGADTILKAGIVSLGLFAGLTAVVFITRTDFSFLGSILAVGGLIALAFIGASIIFGFSLGSVFAFVMVGFAATAILYSTSNVLHSYNPTQHVAASLTLFASVALLFWYILTIFSSDD